MSSSDPQPPPGEGGQDKFSAMASSQSAAPAPKRDKFSAMANRSSTETSVPASSGPKRDKFSAMAGRETSAPKRDKFAAMASRPPDAETAAAAPASSSSTADDATTEQDKYAEWEKRKNQRANVWKDLETAESFVLDLLDQAQQTASVLARQTSDPSNNDEDEMNDDDDDDDDGENGFLSTTSKLANLYRETLSTIHGKLAPHAELVQAYKEPQRINRMYQARIEEGLARQKKELLSGMLQLEQTHNGSSSSTGADEEPNRKRGIDQISSQETK